MPMLLHEDPRYFRQGRGGVWSRIGYSASRVLTARNDQGNLAFNFAEVGGNAMGAATGNAYYPGERRLGDNVERFCSQVWPDIKRKYFARHPHSGHKEANVMEDPERKAPGKDSARRQFVSRR